MVAVGCPDWRVSLEAMTSEPGGCQQFQDFSWEAHDIFNGETAQNLQSQGVGRGLLGCKKGMNHGFFGVIRISFDSMTRYIGLTNDSICPRFF